MNIYKIRRFEDGALCLLINEKYQGVGDRTLIASAILDDATFKKAIGLDTIRFGLQFLSNETLMGCGWKIITQREVLKWIGEQVGAAI